MMLALHNSYKSWCATLLFHTNHLWLAFLILTAFLSHIECVCCSRKQNARLRWVAAEYFVSQWSMKLISARKLRAMLYPQAPSSLLCFLLHWISQCVNCICGTVYNKIFDTKRKKESDVYCYTCSAQTWQFPILHPHYTVAGESARPRENYLCENTQSILGWCAPVPKMQLINYEIRLQKSRAAAK